MGTALPIKTGVDIAPLRILLYGQEGVGKTSWANQEDSLFLTCENGGGDMEYSHLYCGTWPALRGYVRKILLDGVPYRKLVLDTISSFERLCTAWIMEQAKAESIEDVGGGFGKGYTRVMEEMVGLQVDLDSIRMKWGLHVVVLGHAHVKTFNDPNGPAYDKYELMMNAKAASVWTRWADCQIFACFEATVKGGKRGKELEDAMAKGKATGVKRMLYTTKDAAYDAKNRYSLPEELPLAWAPFAKAIRWEEREKRLLSPAQPQKPDPTRAPAAVAAPEPAPAPAAPAPVAPAETEEERQATLQELHAYIQVRCETVVGQALEPDEREKIAADPKLGGPWATNSAKKNAGILARFKQLSDEDFKSKVVGHITVIPF